MTHATTLHLTWHDTTWHMTWHMTWNNAWHNMTLDTTQNDTTLHNTTCDNRSGQLRRSTWQHDNMTIWQQVRSGQKVWSVQVRTGQVRKEIVLIQLTSVQLSGVEPKTLSEQFGLFNKKTQILLIKQTNWTNKSVHISFSFSIFLTSEEWASNHSWRYI